MDLEQELAAFKAKFERTAPAQRVALYDDKIGELRLTFPIDQALQVGESAPDFELPDIDGTPMMLSHALRSGPVVLTFYRGAWCPYCNIQLRAYQAILPVIVRLKARLIAVSPQKPDYSEKTANDNALGFAVLSDVGNVAARRFGLVYSLPLELRAALRANNKALPDMNGDETWELPVPATFVIAPRGAVALAHVDVDYRKRLEPASILKALTALAFN